MKIIRQPHEITTFVVGSRIGGESVLYFETEEEAREFVEIYDNFRTAYTLPYMSVRPAVNGRHILESFKIGLIPWKVIVDQEGHISNIRSHPAHEIAMTTIYETYENGKIRALEIWAPDETHARFYAMDILESDWKEKLGDPSQDVQFMEEIPAAPKVIEEPIQEKRTAGKSSPAGQFIPGFGQAMNLSELEK